MQPHATKDLRNRLSIWWAHNHSLANTKGAYYVLKGGALEQRELVREVAGPHLAMRTCACILLRHSGGSQWRPVLLGCKRYAAVNTI